MYIVTGGAGLIGSSYIWHLNQIGIKDIIVVDHLGDSEKWKNLRGLHYSDYIEKDDFLKYIKNHYLFDAKICFHFGACSSTTETDASYLIKNNFNYSQELAKYCFRQQTRFIYASSCATYGDGHLGYKDAVNPYLKPLNMYGYSKHMFDMWIYKKFNFSNITGLKFSNIYGCNERHKGNMRSVVLKGYEQIKEHGYIELFKSYKNEYADGEQVRDFLYIKDAVKMIQHVVDTNIHGLVNIGSGKTESWNTLAKAIFKALNKPIDIRYIDMPENLKNIYQYYTCADITKLNYNKDSILNIEDAIKDYIEYLEQGRYMGDL